MSRNNSKKSQQDAQRYAVKHQIACDFPAEGIKLNSQLDPQDQLFRYFATRLQPICGMGTEEYKVLLKGALGYLLSKHSRSIVVTADKKNCKVTEKFRATYGMRPRPLPHKARGALSPVMQFG